MPLAAQHYFKTNLITLLTTLCLFLLSHLALAEDNGENKLEISHLRQPTKTIYTAGQPSPEQIMSLKDHSIEHVINLRGPDEIDWDEAKLVGELGLNYHALPINGKNDITFENAEKLQSLLASVGDEATLLHCGSSNRVGALIALDEFVKTGDAEGAVQKGKAWGLTALEEHVKAVMAEKK